MKQTQTQTQGGIGFLGLLTIVFIVLKLTDVIDWSWWFVTMPSWALFALVGILFVIGGILWLAEKIAGLLVTLVRRRATIYLTIKLAILKTIAKFVKVTK